MLLKRNYQIYQIQYSIFPAMNLASSISGKVVPRAFFGEDMAKLSLNG